MNVKMCPGRHLAQRARRGVHQHWQTPHHRGVLAGGAYPLAQFRWQHNVKQVMPGNWNAGGTVFKGNKRTGMQGGQFSRGTNVGKTFSEERYQSVQQTRGRCKLSLSHCADLKIKFFDAPNAGEPRGTRLRRSRLQPIPQGHAGNPHKHICHACLQGRRRERRGELPAENVAGVGDNEGGGFCAN